MKRKLCVVTGSRAEYGLLRWLIKAIDTSSDLELQLIVTGTHLSPAHGYTCSEIESDGFFIDRKVEMLLSAGTPASVAKSMGLGMIGFGDAFQELRPDLLVVLGDRFEIHAAASAAMVASVPVAHLHGGEVTEGAFDESIRHAITKMSHLHFVAAQEYGRRVIQMGEQPERVFVVGGLGVDAIKKVALLPREELEDSLQFKLGKRNLLVTYHPVTLSPTTSSGEMEAMLAALDKLTDTNIIFTLPNADPGNQILSGMIEEFVRCHDNTRAYHSLGQRRYLSCLQYMDGVVGNSSSGLLEAPSFGIGTINVGSRQQGRLKAISVIDCEGDEGSISKALHRLYSHEFQKIASNVVNPYGDGGASAKILDILRNFPLENIIRKPFYDLVH